MVHAFWQAGARDRNVSGLHASWFLLAGKDVGVGPVGSVPCDGIALAGFAVAIAGSAAQAAGCDLEVAWMVARFAGATLGLLAFAITCIAGIVNHNPITVTLSKSILALFIFCLLGLVLGAAAQLVINEHGRNRKRDIKEEYTNSAEPTAIVLEDGEDGSMEEAGETPGAGVSRRAS